MKLATILFPAALPSGIGQEYLEDTNVRVFGIHHFDYRTIDH